MNSKLKLPVYLTVILLSIFACNNGPKVITSSSDQPKNESKTGIFSDESPTEVSSADNSTLNDALHTVKVNEILPSSKYLYINVNEEGVEEPFWIATRIMDINVGEIYFYNGGLLKTNYESKEYNKVFEKIYLISSNLVPADHANNPGLLEKNNASTAKPKLKNIPKPISAPVKIVTVKGSVKIAELVKNFKKYEGKTIQISGVCVKLNANIMGKNWVHLKDGSKDDYDLVVTTNEIINEGTIVSMKAKVSLNKDFGAGYKYDLILEEGTIIP